MEVLCVQCMILYKGKLLQNKVIFKGNPQTSLQDKLKGTIGLFKTHKEKSSRRKPNFGPNCKVPHSAH